MIPLTITDVRAVPGDSAFLIDDGKTALLYDTGFAFPAIRWRNGSVRCWESVLWTIYC